MAALIPRYQCQYQYNFLPIGIIQGDHVYSSTTRCFRNFTSRSKKKPRVPLFSPSFSVVLFPVPLTPKLPLVGSEIHYDRFMAWVRARRLL